MKILDVEVDLAENNRTLIRDFRPHILLVLITQIADAISTTLFMSVDSIDSELNPAVRWLSYQFGIVVGPILGKLLQLLAFWLITCLAIRLARLLCWTVIAINLIAVARNLQHYYDMLG